MRVHEYTIYDFICRNAQLYPNRDCIIFKDIRLSHRDYKVRCDRLAAGLVKIGIAKGDRLAIVAHNSDEYMNIYGAAAKSELSCCLSTGDFNAFLSLHLRAGSGPASDKPKPWE